MNKGYKTEKANTMDSVIVRTSLVTLAAVAGFLALLLLVLPFAAPSFCGRAMKSLGNDAAATHFYEIAYERHSDERRLSDYIETAYGAKNTIKFRRSATTFLTSKTNFRLKTSIFSRLTS